jgi:hypothetical protein
MKLYWVVAPSGRGSLLADESVSNAFLGIARDAEMSDAIKWANSDDPNKREFAIDVLSDIGTRDAIEDLRTLSNDTIERSQELRRTTLRRESEDGLCTQSIGWVDMAESPPK